MACGGQAMSTGAAITAVAVCAILRFAPGCPFARAPAGA
jgi:hypothetical protein